ncbi:hypothetical protein KY336_02430 [Candidatus Woesearchaeota archaeon]|nr:hypothetical protein [Candidatus Woesearchaeota archaeon]
MAKNKGGRIRNFGKRANSVRKRVTNGRDAAYLGKIGLAAGLTHYLTGKMKQADRKLKIYSPGYYVRQARTVTEKKAVSLDQKVDKAIRKVPGGNAVSNANQGLTNYLWGLVGVTPGGKNGSRRKKFEARTGTGPKKGTVTTTRTTTTSTKVPGRYNMDAQNQKTLLGMGCDVLGVMLGVYALKAGYDYFRGRKRK